MRLALTISVTALLNGVAHAQAPSAVDTLIGTVATRWSPEEPLFRVSGIALAPDGRMFVAERDDSRVRAFDPRTGGSAVLLRKGGGPMEVSGPCCLAITTDGFLIVRDNGNARWVGVRIAAGRESTFVVRHAVPSGNAEIPTAVDEASFADQHWTLYSANGRLGRRRTQWIGTAGLVLSTVDYAAPTWDSTVTFARPYGSGNSNGVRYAYPLFGRKTVRGAWPSGMTVEANSDRYLVRILDRSGRTATVIERAGVVGALLTRAERDAAAKQLGDDARRLRVREADLPFRVPDRKPVLEGLTTHAGGILLVHRSVAQGQPRQADVFNDRGQQLAALTWPASMRLLSFDWTSREAAAVELTDDGEETAVRIRFNRH